jgi:hypothetical protein
LALVQFGKVSFDPEKVLEGVVSDNVCASSPCFHNGTCHVTWNDFWCQCPRGYTGKTCQEMEFCQLQDCPSGSKCQNLDDGYECVANATFDGIGTSFTYVYNHPDMMNLTDSTIDRVRISYRSNGGGTLMHMAPKSGNAYFTVSVYEDKITVAWKFSYVNSGLLTFGKPEPDGNWTTIVLKLSNNSIECGFDDTSDEAVSQVSPNFSFVDWYELLLEGSITLGGLGNPLSDRHTYMTIGTERHIESRDAVSGNSVELADRKLTTAMPPHSMLAGKRCREPVIGAALSTLSRGPVTHNSAINLICRRRGVQGLPWRGADRQYAPPLLHVRGGLPERELHAPGVPLAAAGQRLESRERRLPALLRQRLQEQRPLPRPVQQLRLRLSGRLRRGGLLPGHRRVRGQQVRQQLDLRRRHRQLHLPLQDRLARMAVSRVQVLVLLVVVVVAVWGI